LSLGDGTLFGHSIWIECVCNRPLPLLFLTIYLSITVEEPSRHLKGASDEASLASSSIVMPASAPVRSASTNATASTHNVQHSPSSRATAVSRLTLEDAVSDDGSDASSVSLISVPSSEDVEDDEVWQDSRSHVLVTSPERARAALEYVVLYDESSEEEL
jgi:next to BRCA1 gene 1 protein